MRFKKIIQVLLVISIVFMSRILVEEKTYSEEKEVLREEVLNNPFKEVKKLILPKNRESSEMNITVTKTTKDSKKAKRYNSDIGVEIIELPQNVRSTEYYALGKKEYITGIYFDGKYFKVPHQYLVHYAKGNIIFTMINSNTKYRISRVGGYVAESINHDIEIITNEGARKKFLVKEYPQRELIEKRLSDYRLREDIAKKEPGTFFRQGKVRKEFVNGRSQSWWGALGIWLRQKAGDPYGSLYGHLEMLKSKDVNVPTNTLGEIQSGALTVVGLTVTVAPLFGSYKILFNPEVIPSRNILDIKVDGRLFDYLKNINERKFLVAGKYLGESLKDWGSDMSEKDSYSGLAEIQKSEQFESKARTYKSVWGRSEVGNLNNKAIFSEKYSSREGLSLPLESFSRDFFDGFSIRIDELSKGGNEQIEFVYVGVDGRNYRGKVNIQIGNQQISNGDRILDVGNLPNEKKELYIENSINSKGLNGVGNIINNLSLNINGKTLQVGDENGPLGKELVYCSKNYDIGIDQNTRSIIFKKKNDVPFDDKVVIRYKYKKVLLGVLNIRLKNKGADFYIESGNLDFGKISKGESKKASSRVVVGGIQNRIVELKLTSGGMLKEGRTDKIDLEKLEVSNIKKIDTNRLECEVSGEVSVTEEVNSGKYEGSANLEITILPTEDR